MITADIADELTIEAGKKVNARHLGSGHTEASEAETVKVHPTTKKVRVRAKQETPKKNVSGKIVKHSDPKQSKNLSDLPTATTTSTDEPNTLHRRVLKSGGRRMRMLAAIKALQTTGGFMISRAAFKHMVKYICQNIWGPASAEMRMSKGAINLLQYAAEDWIVSAFTETSKLTEMASPPSFAQPSVRTQMLRQYTDWKLANDRAIASNAMGTTEVSPHIMYRESVLQPQRTVSEAQLLRARTKQQQIRREKRWANSQEEEGEQDSGSE